MCWNKWKFHPTAGKCLLGHFPDGGWKWVKWDFAGCDASHLMSQIEKCVNTDSRHCKEGEDVSVYLFLSICTFVPYFKQKCVFRLSFIVPFGSWCCVETTVLNSAKTSLSYHMYQESHTLIWAQNSGGKSLDICDDAGYYLNTSVYFP